jgi:hypothetical protein
MSNFTPKIHHSTRHHSLYAQVAELKSKLDLQTKKIKSLRKQFKAQKKQHKGQEIVATTETATITMDAETMETETLNSLYRLFDALDAKHRHTEESAVIGDNELYTLAQDVLRNWDLYEAIEDHDSYLTAWYPLSDEHFDDETGDFLNEFLGFMAMCDIGGDEGEYTLCFQFDGAFKKEDTIFVRFDLGHGEITFKIKK